MCYMFWMNGNRDNISYLLSVNDAYLVQAVGSWRNRTWSSMGSCSFKLKVHSMKVYLNIFCKMRVQKKKKKKNGRVRLLKAKLGVKSFRSK